MNNESKYPLDFIKEVQAGGFVESDIVFKDRDPIEIVRESDNEVCAVYTDPEDENVLWKQTWKAEGSGNRRYNFTHTITEVRGNESG